MSVRQPVYLYDCGLMSIVASRTRCAVHWTCSMRSKHPFACPDDIDDGDDADADDCDTHKEPSHLLSAAPCESIVATGGSQCGCERLGRYLLRSSY